MAKITSLPDQEWTALDSTMDIYSKPGTKIRFRNCGGYPAEAELAAKVLNITDTYTVESIDVHSSISYVRLYEFPNESFNTVMFSEA